MRMTCGKGGKWWEVSPTLINSGMRIKRENEEKKRETKRGRKRIERERNGEKKKRFSRHSDGRISTVQELNSIHTTRATRGYQNLGVLSNSKR